RALSEHKTLSISWSHYPQSESMPIEKTRAMAPSIYKEYECQFTSESQEINLTLKLKNMIISMQTGIA
ncbi:hypothetical protein, partial [Cronobacter sakazakii]